MKALVDRIQREAIYLGDGIVKVDGFLNHQIDPFLTEAMGEAFIERFAELGVTGLDRVVTAEVSGIPPALATGRALGLPVVYARKKRPATLIEHCYQSQAPSRTKGGTVQLMISEHYLGDGERVVIIDDFLATGRTILALSRMVAEAGAKLQAVGCVIEKPAEGGRDLLDDLGVPVVTLARIELTEHGLIVS